MRQLTVVMTLFLSVAGVAADLSYAETLIRREVIIECQPTYGHYQQSSRWGWYGAKREVRTPVEAKELLDNFFVQNSNIKVVRITERPHFFIAEIINRKGVVVDLILIDRRTGRIRSMF